MSMHLSRYFPEVFCRGEDKSLLISNYVAASPHILVVVLDTLLTQSWILRMRWLMMKNGGDARRTTHHHEFDVVRRRRLFAGNSCCELWIQRWTLRREVTTSWTWTSSWVFLKKHAAKQQQTETIIPKVTLAFISYYLFWPQPKSKVNLGCIAYLTI